MKKQVAISTIGLIFITFSPLFAALFIFEVYCRLNAEKFPSYGWQTSNITDEKIMECVEDGPKNGRFLVFGDSFVEFYGDSKNNLVSKLRASNPTKSFCNFGLSGTGLDVYGARLQRALDAGITNVENIIIFLYEGNDFSDHMLQNRSSKGVDDRVLSPMRKAIKGSYAANIIYREVWKKYFSNRSLTSFQLASSLGFKEVDYNRAEKIFMETPAPIIRKMSADLINVSWYAVALSKPDYFSNLLRPSDSEFDEQKEIVLGSIDKILTLASNHSVRVKFFIIPHDFLLFDETRMEWSEIYRFSYSKEAQGETRISKYLLAAYPNIFTTSHLYSRKDFIPLDGHLTSAGNDKLAHFVSEKIGLR